METSDFLYAVNFRAVALLTKLAIPYLVKTKGNVVNVSSISAQCPSPADDVFYCAMKAALDQFTRVFANLYGAQGVRVNAISPGPVETMILSAERGAVAGGASGLAKWSESNTVLQRPGQPSEMASILKFLASEEASYVTGAIWLADGGLMVKGPPPLVL